MNCREALEHFHDHVDNELSPFQRWRLRLHVWVCGHCRKYLRSYKTTVRAEKAAFREDDAVSATEIPDDLVASIMSAVKNPQNVGDSNDSAP